MRVGGKAAICILMRKISVAHINELGVEIFITERG